MHGLKLITPRLRRILQNNWLVLLRNVKGKQDKVKLKNAFSLKDAKETWQLRLHVMTRLTYKQDKHKEKKTVDIRDIIEPRDEIWICTMH